MISGRRGSLYKPLCRYPREPSNDTSLTRSAFWTLAATWCIWEREGKSVLSMLSHRKHLIGYSYRKNTTSVYIVSDGKVLSVPVIPAEHREWEPRDHPLNEEKGLGFSFSSNCRITNTHIKGKIGCFSTWPKLSYVFGSK